MNDDRNRERSEDRAGALRIIAIALAIPALPTLIYQLEKLPDSSPGLLAAPATFLVLSAIVMAAAVYLLARSVMSLVREPDSAETQLATGRRRKELEREKQSLLKALKELEFDHQMRKISETDYAEISARYRARAIAVMKRLDEAGIEYRQLIERDVAERAKRLGKDGKPVAAPSEPAPERATATAAAVEKEPA